MNEEDNLKAMQKAMKTVIGMAPDIEKMKLIKKIRKPIAELHGILSEAYELSPKEGMAMAGTILTALLRPLKSRKMKETLVSLFLEVDSQGESADDMQSVKEFFEHYRKESK